ncbi:MAG: phospholipid carrier-dependent glycosyltransferase [Nitrospina sp.]|nr:phospholipid carrier-dependent glycosyltransferase [Nitrospina sp.]
MKLKSPTYDESYHLTSGYISLTKNEFRYGANQPPLIKSLAAFPLLFMGLSLPENQDPLVDKHWTLLGKYFLFSPGNNVDQIIFIARLPLVFLALLLGFYVFLWARDLYGERAGLMALTLYVFSPNILAYSRLATTDFGAACFIFIACYHIWDYLQQPIFKKLCLTGLFFGLALVVKFSTLVLFPIFFLILFGKYLSS